MAREIRSRKNEERDGNAEELGGDIVGKEKNKE